MLVYCKVFLILCEMFAQIKFCLLRFQTNVKVLHSHSMHTQSNLHFYWPIQ